MLRALCQAGGFAQRAIDSSLPARPARAEVLDDVWVETQRDQLFGWQLLRPADATVSGDDFGHHLRGRPRSCKVLLGPLRIFIVRNRFRVLVSRHSFLFLCRWPAAA